VYSISPCPAGRNRRLAGNSLGEAELSRLSDEIQNARTDDCLHASAKPQEASGTCEDTVLPAP